MDGSSAKGVSDETADALAAALEPLPSWDGADGSLVNDINTGVADVIARR